MDFDIKSYNDIFKLISKGKHIIFFLDPNGNLINNEKLAIRLFGENLDGSKNNYCEIMDKLIMKDHFCYILECSDYEKAQKFFYIHFFAYDLKNNDLYITLWSNGEFQLENV